MMTTEQMLKRAEGLSELAALARREGDTAHAEELETAAADWRDAAYGVTEEELAAA